MFSLKSTILILIAVFSLISAAAHAQPPELPAALAGYSKTMRESGAAEDDLLLKRLRVQSLPAEFFVSPVKAPVKEGILIDMLAYYYLGYRVVQLWVHTDDGWFQRMYSEKNNRLGGWEATDRKRLDSALRVLSPMRPLSLAEVTPRNPAAAGAMNGYLGDRTYNTQAPKPAGFAGYVGVLTLWSNQDGRAAVTKQMPLGIPDFDQVIGQPGLREPAPGRIKLALAGFDEAEIARRQHALVLERDLATANMPAIEKAIVDKAGANLRFADGYTPLLVAVTSNKPDLVQWLLAKGSDINQADLRKNTPLALAVKQRTPVLVDLLLSHRANPDPEPNDRAETPLSLALWSQDPAMTERLLKAGASPNRRHSWGEDALMIAAGTHVAPTTTENMKLLLRYGANPANVGAPPLCRTALSVLREKNPALADELRNELAVSEAARQECQRVAAAKAAAVSARPPEDDPKVQSDRIASVRAVSASLNDNLVMTEMRLLTPPPKILALLARMTPAALGPNKEGSTALHLAFRDLSEYRSLTRNFIKAGVPVNAKDQYQVTALMLASGEGDIKSILALLEAGARLEDVDRDGATALTFAVLAGKTEAVKVLIGKGASVKVVQKDGQTLLALARQQRFTEIESLLRTPR